MLFSHGVNESYWRPRTVVASAISILDYSTLPKGTISVPSGIVKASRDWQSKIANLGRMLSVYSSNLEVFSQGDSTHQELFKGILHCRTLSCDHTTRSKASSNLQGTQLYLLWGPWSIATPKTETGQSMTIDWGTEKRSLSQPSNLTSLHFLQHCKNGSV